MLLPRCMLASFLIIALVPLFGRSQGPITPPHPLKDADQSYQNSADGLRWQLQDFLNSARDHGRDRLDALIHETEIPNYAEWFVGSFGPEKGEMWARAYEQNLVENGKKLADAMVQLSEEDGEFAVRIVNDHPFPGRKIEGEMVDGLQRPVDIFFATWRNRGLPPNSASFPIGYFVFVGGRFRLDSAIDYADIQGGPVKYLKYPSCTYCPDPSYTKEARAKHIEGQVALNVTITPDGRATDIIVVKTVDAGLAQNAVEAVSKWRFEPALRADGEPVPVRVPLEVTFRLVQQK